MPSGDPSSGTPTRPETGPNTDRGAQQRLLTLGRQFGLDMRVPPLDDPRPGEHTELNWTTDALLLRGDNLASLAHLHATSLRVRAVYIDPPYNTGRTFIYPDRIATGPAGSGHVAWMQFMVPRLRLAHALMQADGVLFVSIDDHEQAYLRLLLDAVFGEAQFVAQFVVRRGAGHGDRRDAALNHEYVLCYRRSPAAGLRGQQMNHAQAPATKPPGRAPRRYSRQDERGAFRLGSLLRKKGEGSLRTDRPNLYYPLYVTADGQVHFAPGEDRTEIYPQDAAGTPRRWVWSRETAMSRQRDLFAGRTGAVYLKEYAQDHAAPAPRTKARTLLDHPDYWTARATEEVTALYGARVFETPKAVRLITDLLDLVDMRPGEVVLDFFAGTGTTAAAVARLNARDGVPRRVVLAEQQTPVHPEHPAARHGYASVSDLTAVRLAALQHGAGFTWDSRSVPADARSAPGVQDPRNARSAAALDVTPPAEFRTVLTSALHSVRTFLSTPGQDRLDDPARVLQAGRLAALAALGFWTGCQATLPTERRRTARPPPGHLDTGAPSAAETRLARTVAEAATGLPPLKAAYLIGSVYTHLLPASWRERHGAFYTPPDVVRRMYALLDLAAADARQDPEGPAATGIDWTRLRVADLACGGGMLLIPAAQRLLKNPALKGDLGGRLWGRDLDPLGAWLAQLHLDLLACPHLPTGAPLPAPVIHAADSLSADDEEQADLVIGNPPYGKVTLSADLRIRFARSLYGHANLYGVFTDLAVRACAPGGHVCLVTPTSFLSGLSFRALRRTLGQQAPLVASEVLQAREGVFEGVQQEAVLSVFRKEPDRAGAAGAAPVPRRVRVRLPPADAWVHLPADPAAPWMMPRHAGDVALSAALHGMPGRLRDLGYRAATGQIVWNRHAAHLHQQALPGSLPLIWADAVRGHTFSFRPEQSRRACYLLPTERHRALRVTAAGVLVQRTTAKEQARRLVAAELPQAFLDEHGGAFIENHLNVLQATRPRVRADTLARLLASAVVDRALRTMSGSVAISAAELGALPLPSVAQMQALERAIDAGAERGEQERLIASYYGEQRQEKTHEIN